MCCYGVSHIYFNRAMDKEMANGLTLRNIYEYGSKLHKLEDSKLSNHIGLNGMVKTSDDKLIFVKRSKDVSIGKNVLGTSMAAALKAKDVVNHQGEFCLEGLQKGVNPV